MENTTNGSKQSINLEFDNKRVIVKRSGIYNKQLIKIIGNNESVYLTENDVLNLYKLINKNDD